jgi:transposase
MTSSENTPGIVVGVDTHLELHVAAALTADGAFLGSFGFPSTEAGYKDLLSWCGAFGIVVTFAIEGTSSYGAGLTKFLGAHGLNVVEVQRPNRQVRRKLGKSDVIDAEAAARTYLAGQASGQAKTQDGIVEMIRVLRSTRRSAIQSQTQAMNQMKAVVVTAPEALRQALRELSNEKLVSLAAGFRVSAAHDCATASKLALCLLANRHQSLKVEVKKLDHELDRLTNEVAPGLRALLGVGTEVASTLLVTVGDNPQRLKSESSFAMLCAVAPLPASSGKSNRHRLNRGGDRQANQALWRIVITRMSCDERTQEYVARRTGEGLSKREIIRCLKRYVAREVFAVLIQDRAVLPRAA